jgi:NAD+ synthase
MFKVVQDAIIRELNVKPVIDVDQEINRRVDFLADYLRKSGQRTYTLGISGGVDSTTAGKLAQLAIYKLKSEGYDAEFIAVRLPYHTQRDEADAQAALNFIQPDITLTCNIGRASEAVLFEVHNEVKFNSIEHEDFVMGNIKARQRMIMQYAIAGATGGLVIGTDHAAEAVMGFFTKGGDGFADIMPLAGLTKRQVKAIGKALGAPDKLVNKTPTADLENLDPGKPDEVAYGVTYDEIDDYLEGKEISSTSEQRIIDQFSKTIHKRALPVTP